MKFDIIRAWKDESYRQGLSSNELNELPANPAGELELSDAELETIAFGCGASCAPGTVGGISPIAVTAPVHPACFNGAVIVNHNNSVAVICEVNVNSLNLINLAVLGAVTNFCANSN